MTAATNPRHESTQTSPTKDVSDEITWQPSKVSTRWAGDEGVSGGGGDLLYSYAKAGGYIRPASGTGQENKSDNASAQDYVGRVGLLPVERIYPHVFDDDKAGQALIYLRAAIDDAKGAIDAFGEPDIPAVDSRLSQIAVLMGKTHPLTVFNESFGAVVSFVRRATLAASSTELSRSALNSLVHVLELSASNPMLDLDEATDLIEKLASEGWKGEHQLASELLMALADDYGMTTDDMQALLFPTPETSVE